MSGQSLRRINSNQSAMSIATLYNSTRDSVLGDAVEVASTTKTRNKGIPGPTGLEPGVGLWIVPC